MMTSLNFPVSINKSSLFIDRAQFGIESRTDPWFGLPDALAALNIRPAMRNEHHPNE
jgi:hypothetical protein